ncbi:MAG: pyridoxal-dependent decarboxylase [Acidobacteriota bacterium]
MNIEEFRKNAHETIDWMADYFKNIEDYPVRSKSSPGETYDQIPSSPPEKGELFKDLIGDLDKIIMPGITHWQSPSFFAYFNANNSFPSILAEMITATLGAQCMSWQTSPAATELEEMVMKWLAEMLNLPGDFHGVIQDTASTATLCSILTAREKLSGFKVNSKGFSGNRKFTAYCSSEAHSSIDKAIRIAGIGSDNLRKIDVDENYAMDPEKLEKTIKNDINKGFTPLIVIAAFGTTGSTAVDPVKNIGEISEKYNLWFHIDAAYAGTALILPENRWMIAGIESADTFVFNPHKWMFTNFDCSAYFVKDKDALLRTFSILPEYLKTKEGDRVNNYRDWGIALGRRFRALKLWFVIRSFGVKGLQQKIREHIRWADNLKEKIENSDDFEIMAPVLFATVCFRYKPSEKNDTDELNKLNEQLLEKLNSSGKLYLTHTKLNNIYTIRFVVGQTYQEEHHILNAWDLIKKTAKEI